ncbi:hypothetical protein ATZ36_16595 [Candidatus Endomicrobiellum trichonymphae]|uniref:Uncharacterized protein n=1 Tax=Endomicrobium trichonymphae TaxID=1408204 RepID=A0A1E5IJL9_ENDTX|nr:hypothetical protein ATZ36_16595 [Candidatus Endomicrobium trichonymphae]
MSDIQIKMAKNNNILNPLVKFFGVVAAAATLVYSGYRIMQGSLKSCYTTKTFFICFVAGL